MKKLILSLLIVLVSITIAYPQDYDNAGMDYTKALFENKTASARITALKNYIKNYTDTSNKFVKLAYYQLALNYFENNQYSNAVKTGEKTFKLGSIGTGEEARLSLVLANSYGIKSYSGFNKDKALKYVAKAIRLGNETSDKDVISTAKKLKKSLSGPPPKKISPEQKIKMHYSDEEYRQAIRYYSSLGASDKKNLEIKKIYAYSLFKAKRYDTALLTFKSLYQREAKGVYPKYMGDIYSKKVKSDKKNYDLAAINYLEASVLYKMEGSSSNQKIAAGKAKVQLENKYVYKAKYRKYQSDIKKQQSSSQKNEKAIRDAKRAVRNFKRYLRKTYTDVQAPQYEMDKQRKLENNVINLESGFSGSSDNSAGEDLLKLKKKIDAEYSSLLKKAQKKFEK